MEPLLYEDLSEFGCTPTRKTLLQGRHTALQYAAVSLEANQAESAHPRLADMASLHKAVSSEDAFFNARKVLQSNVDRAAQLKGLFAAYAKWHRRQLRPENQLSRCVVWYPLAGLGDSATTLASVFAKAVAAGHLFFVSW